MTLISKPATILYCGLHSLPQDYGIFCGFPDTKNHLKDIRGLKLVRVRTSDFHVEIDKVCSLRKNKWADTVKGRLTNVDDLFPAGSFYRQVCSVNFRTQINTTTLLNSRRTPFPIKAWWPKRVSTNRRILQSSCLPKRKL